MDGAGSSRRRIARPALFARQGLLPALLLALLTGCGARSHEDQAAGPLVYVPSRLPAPVRTPQHAGAQHAGAQHTGDQHAGAPQPGGMVEVTMVRDPVTGRLDGPFDRQTGYRIQTRPGPDGRLHVVLDPVNGTPVLLLDRPGLGPLNAAGRAVMPAAPPEDFGASAGAGR